MTQELGPAGCESETDVGPLRWGRVHREVPMKCTRCGGRMVYQKFYGLQDQFWGWRCIYCGEIIDQVILANRQFSRTGR